MNADQVEESKAKAVVKLGIMTGVIALIELICGFIYLSIGGRDGSGLWSGAGLGVIAALGIVTWLKKNKTVLVFYLVMCILWFIANMIQLVIAYIAYLIWHIIRKVVETNCNQIGDVCECRDTDNTPIIVHNCDDIRTLESIFMCLAIMSAAAAILTLAGSIIGCKGTCCARPAPSNVVVMQQPVGYPVVMQPGTVTQQEYPAQPYPGQQAYPGEQPYPGQQAYPGQQPVMMAQGGEAPPGYDQGDLPPKQEQSTKF